MTLLYVLTRFKIKHVRGRFKTQPAGDRPEPPVLAGCYCSEQWQPPGTGAYGRWTAGWVLKSSLSSLVTCCSFCENVQVAFILISLSLPAHPVEIPTTILSHSALQDELSNPMNGTSAKKHLCQVASLLGQLQNFDLLGSDTCYVEFGAGRGE